MTAVSRVQGLAVTVGKAHSLHLTEIELPEVNSDQVLIDVLEAGICGTDREIIASQYGSAPPNQADLVLGHEALGVIRQIGSAVSGLAVGDLVTATVRRGCGCPNCAAGESDFCTSLRYTERGIQGRHGFWTTSYVEDEANVLLVPASLRAAGVLAEPCSVVEKAWRVAQSVQQRFPVWEPKTAVIFGAGPIGLLQAMLLRNRGMDVTVVAQRPKSEAPAAEVVAKIGATYISARKTDIVSLGRDLPNIDIIVECSGSSACVAQAMQILGNAGVLVLLSNTGGTHTVNLPLDQINVGWVSGNKTMVGAVNSSAADFRAAIVDMQRFEDRWPGALAALITHRLPGLAAGVNLMESTRGAIKAVIEIGS